VAKAARPVAILRIGQVGWSIRKEYAEHFPTDGSHLERYAQTFSCTEIDSSFYKPHKPATYARWATSVPAGFRFAVKVPKEITHQKRLIDVVEPLDRFLGEATSLGDKLGPLLVQLPPSLALGPAAGPFFASLRERFDGDVVFEPRHRSWFSKEGEMLLEEHRVARAAADPAVVPEAGEPGGWAGLAYYRLHGSPRVYYSAYSDEYLDALEHRLIGKARSSPVWCIFDNTAEGMATANALDLLRRLERSV
jgi:uncharacterized protein YecE (DUF72 family)